MNVEIANKLVKLRKQMGLSQEELAEKIGVSRQAVSKWERSESSPDTDNLIALSKVYQISIDEMLDPETETAASDKDSNESEEETHTDDAAYDESDWHKEPGVPGLAGIIPILATIVFLALGLIWGLWHPGWLVFLLVPVFIFLVPAKVNGKWVFRKSIRKLPYPVFATFLFLLLGFVFNGWVWSWLVFLTIPVWAILIKR